MIIVVIIITLIIIVVLNDKYYNRNCIVINIISRRSSYRDDGTATKCLGKIEKNLYLERKRSDFSRDR